MKLCDKYKTGKGYRKRIQEIYLRHVEGKIINIFENLFVSMTEYTILITNFSKIKKKNLLAALLVINVVKIRIFFSNCRNIRILLSYRLSIRNQ